MTDDQLKDMVISHDKALDRVPDLSAKLDKLIGMTSNISVMNERLSNIDKQFVESFNTMKARVGKVELTAETLEKEVPKKVSYSFLQWAIVFIAGYSVSFAVYIVGGLHDLDIKVDSHVATHKQAADATASKIRDVEARCERYFNK